MRHFQRSLVLVFPSVLSPLACTPSSTLFNPSYFINMFPLHISRVLFLPLLLTSLCHIGTPVGTHISKLLNLASPCETECITLVFLGMDHMTQNYNFQIPPLAQEFSIFFIAQKYSTLLIKIVQSLCKIYYFLIKKSSTDDSDILLLVILQKVESICSNTFPCILK